MALAGTPTRTRKTKQHGKRDTLPTKKNRPAIKRSKKTTPQKMLGLFLIFTEILLLYSNMLLTSNTITDLNIKQINIDFKSM